MPTAYEDLCNTLVEHARRDEAFETKCRDLALGFRNALIGLGFPPENLQWVPFGDRSLDTPPHQFSEAKKILQDEGCDSVTLRVRAGMFFMWPVLKMRFEEPLFTLLVVDKAFTAPDAQAVARDAAAYFVDSVRQTVNALPAAWLREFRPQPMKKVATGLGFRLEG